MKLLLLAACLLMCTSVLLALGSGDSRLHLWGPPLVLLLILGRGRLGIALAVAVPLWHHLRHPGLPITVSLLQMLGLVLALASVDCAMRLRLGAEGHRGGAKDLLPICSSCKKIRDESAVWQPLEEYLSKASRISFSHSLCPNCSQSQYLEFLHQWAESNKDICAYSQHRQKPRSLRIISG